MKTVFKYEIPRRVMSDGLAEIGEFELAMPRDAEPLSVGVQRGAPVLWALVDPEQNPVRHSFKLVGTGHEGPPDPHWFVGTYQLDWFVGHVFHLGEV